MWFKNLIVYRLPADWSVSAAELEEKFDLDYHFKQVDRIFERVFG